MANTTKRVPDGYHTVTPQITVKDSGKAIEFYKKAFGAKELYRMPGPGGKGIMHAELQIGTSRIFLGDEFPGMGTCKSPESLGGANTGSLCLYVEDVDSAFNQAIAAGGKVAMPVMDMFWGDRYGKFTDPFGHEWGIASHIEDVSPEEMKKRGDEFFAQMAQKH